MKNGRLEGLITIPAGGWQAAINDGAAFNVVLSASVTYTPTELATAFEAALEAGAGSGQTYTVTIANGEGGTGKVTFTCTAVFTVTWTSTALRDALGFTGNLSGATSYTSTNGLLGMWLPDCPMQYRRPRGNGGFTEGGVSQTISPSGAVKTIVTTSRTKVPPVSWSHVTLARALQESEANGVRSFERFLGCLRGTPSAFLPGSQVRVYWDADMTVYTAIVPRIPESNDLDPVDENWRGLYACQIEGWAV